MTTLFLMLIPVLLLFYFNQRVRTVLTLLYRQIATMSGSNICFNLLLVAAGTAAADDDTVESPKDTGPTQPIKQSYR